MGVPVIPRQRAELSGVDCERMRHLHACDSTADAATTKCSVGDDRTLIALQCRSQPAEFLEYPEYRRVPVQPCSESSVGTPSMNASTRFLSVCETDYAEYCTDDETSQ